MINARLFEAMKPGATLVNCARAGVINEADLRAVKATKKIFYLNDVYPKDEAGEKSVADVADLMMPHLGANTFEANFNAARKSAEQIVDYFEKGITTAVVNKSLPDGLDAKYQHLAYVLTSLTRAYLGTDQNPARVETSFYGTLGQFANWMTPAIAAAIAGNSALDRSPRDAEQYLAEAGVELVNREVDNKKNYGASMSLDIFAGDSPIYKGGCRGTIIENKLMISRLNDFDGLYLDPVGHHLFVEYADEPGIIGAIAGILGEKNINIIDIRAPQDPRSGRSLSVITTNVEVPDMLVDKIRETVNASKAFRFSYFA
jgi:D-3-phosphoglycerate dehydrogenase